VLRAPGDSLNAAAKFIKEVIVPFWKCFYHIVWATKHRQPTITGMYEPILFAEIKHKAKEQGCEVLGINAAGDHVHLALSIPPALAAANLTGHLKGASSRAINQAFENADRFHWQESYGILTFSESRLPMVLSYIEHQKEHHQNGTLQLHLEKIDE
jgi:putative transposase